MAGDIKTILCLNEDCIMKIFSYLLPNEVIEFVSAIPSFSTVYEDYLKHERTLPLVQFVKNYPTNLIAETMRRVGSELKRITIDGLSTGNIDYHIQLLIDHCKNIETLEIQYIHAFSFNLWSQLLKGLKLLKKLNVNTSPFNDDICESLENTSLEHLTVDRGDLTGKHLNKLKKLSTLNLLYCNRLSSEHMKNMFKSIKLEQLNIKGSNDLDDSVFSTMTSTQDRLKVLHMSNNYYGACIELVAKLPALKELYVYEIDSESKCYALFEELANFKESQLECLQVSNMWITEEGMMNDLIYKLVNLRRLGLIYDRYVDDEFLKNVSINLPKLSEFLCPAACDITNDGVLEFIKNANALELMDLSECVKLTTELVIDIIKILKERKTENAKPLKLFVAGTKIDESVLEQNDEYKNNKHLISLSYKENWPYGSPVDLYNLDEDC